MTAVEVGTPPEKGPSFRASLAVLVLGLLVAIPGVVVVGSGVWRAVSDRPIRFPAWSGST